MKVGGNVNAKTNTYVEPGRREGGRREKKEGSQVDANIFSIYIRHFWSTSFYGGSASTNKYDIEKN